MLGMAIRVIGSGRAQQDIPLGDRAGGLPRPRRGGAPDRRGAGAAAEAVGLRALPTRDATRASSARARGLACCSARARASFRRTGRGASTAPTRPPPGTTRARPRTRRTARSRTRASRRQRPTRHPGRPAPGLARARMDELPGGIRRVTFPLPLGIDHVHCYLLPGDDGLDARRHRARPSGRRGALAAGARRARRAGGADRRSRTSTPTTSAAARIVAGADRRAGAPGRARLRAVRARLGPRGLVRPDGRVPAGQRASRGRRRGAAPGVPHARAVHPLRARPRADRRGRRRRRLARARAPGPRRRPHLPPARTTCSSPATTCSPGSRRRSASTRSRRPDPLGDYLASLERTIELAPRVALPGHGEPIEDPVARAREIVEHHRVRLDETAAALAAGAAHRLRGLARALRRATSTRAAAASPSPSRSRTSSGSSGEGRAAARRGRRHRLLYCGVDPVGRRQTA